MKTIVIRHAESINNARQKQSCFQTYKRHPNAPLTSRGKQQAFDVAEQLHKALFVENEAPTTTTFDIYTSEMTRSIETGIHICQRLKKLEPKITFCIVPLPFCHEIGSQGITAPKSESYNDTDEDCHFDNGLFSDCRQKSELNQGDFDKSYHLFKSIVVPRIINRNKSNTLIFIFHGNYMRKIFSVFRYYKNTEMVECELMPDNIGFK